jgi:Flp pilus assembly protein TadG
VLNDRPEPRRTDRGSVLMLMPAAVLIVLLLGAIAVDLTVVHMRQRAAISAAGSAANDAVTYGLDQAALRRGDGYRLDPDRVARAVAESIESQGLSADLVAPPEVTEPGPGTVTVVLRIRVGYIFAKALPHGPRATTVTATATASVEQR